MVELDFITREKLASLDQQGIIPPLPNFEASSWIPQENQAAQEDRGAIPDAKDGYAAAPS